MNLQIKTRYFILGVFIVFLGLFLCGWYLGIKKANASLISMENIHHKEIKRYISKIGDDSVKIFQIEQEVLTLREAIKQDKLEKETLKKLNLKQVSEISKLKLRIDTLLEKITHSGSIIVVYDTITNMPENALLLPFGFSKKDRWLNLDGTFSEKGDLDIALSMDVSVDVITGIDKKTKKSTISIITDNKYIDVINILSYKTDVVRPKKYGIGFHIGYGVTKNLEMSPYIGIGVSRSLICF